VASIYLPNGNPPQTEKYSYKLAFMDRLIAHARNLLALEAARSRRRLQCDSDRDCADPAAWEGDAFCRHQGALSIPSPPRSIDAARRRTTPGSIHFGITGRLERNNGIRIDHHFSPRGGSAG
jgi:exodeoxyribonuclease-3